MLRVSDIRQHFIDELTAESFTIDRSGAKTIEMLGASFIADEDAIFGKVNWDYVNEEIDWYDSMSTNINDISETPPVAWKATGNKYGEINSNYGLLINGDQYFNQYDRALEELIKNPNSRRASMIYNRPSIHVDAFANGKNDFICTNAVTYYIRNGKMDCVVQMRSNDVVFGYKNDRAWQREVLLRMVEDYNDAVQSSFHESISVGNIYWQVQNLHVYERHFKLVKLYVDEYDTTRN